MLLCKRHNDSGAGFTPGDGRLPSLPEPTLRDASRDFQPIRGCASIRFSCHAAVKKLFFYRLCMGRTSIVFRSKAIVWGVSLLCF